MGRAPAGPSVPQRVTSRSLASLAAESLDLDEIDDATARALLWDWDVWARPEQLPPPGDWWCWIIIAGRGWGKTRVGAEVTRAAKAAGATRIGLIGRTAADVRKVMVQGESGLIAVHPPGDEPAYLPSQAELVWPDGTRAQMYSADKPEQLRGPQNQFIWCDEPCAWRYPEALDMARMGLRIGDHPRMVLTTTPRPMRWLRDLMQEEGVVVTRGSTYDNRGNLPKSFLAQLEAKYAGTELGRQELEAEILDEVAGALWSLSLIESTTVGQRGLPPMRRIMVGVDPARTATSDSDETGIVVVGLGEDGHGYVLDDVSGRYTPKEWADAAVGAYHKWGATAIAVETNIAGELTMQVIRTVAGPGVPIIPVHAAKGKHTRAQPIAALWEQGRAHIVGRLAELEDQMVTWRPGETSPDRLDAMVWGSTACWSSLLLGPDQVVERTKPERRAGVKGGGRRSIRTIR